MISFRTVSNFKMLSKMLTGRFIFLVFLPLIFYDHKMNKELFLYWDNNKITSTENIAKIQMAKLRTLYRRL